MSASSREQQNIKNDAGSSGTKASNAPVHDQVEGYNALAYPSIALTVDLVVFAMIGKELNVALIERGENPFKGMLALPGGFVQPNENALQAAHRELAEETGLDLGRFRVHIEQLATYTAPTRDPRMRVASVAHWVLLGQGELGHAAPTLKAGTDARAARWQPVHQLKTAELAFDHAEIFNSGLERLAGKMEYTTVAATLVREKFTISELRDVYLAVWQRELPAGNFTRKMRSSLTPTGDKVYGVGAPASLFSVGSSWISPPWSRAET